MKTIHHLIEALESRIAPAFASSIAIGLLSGSAGGEPGFRIDGASDSDHVGFSVADAGDVNGDGYGDLIIGAPDFDVNGNNNGAAYVIYGSDTGFSPTLDLGNLGTHGFRVENDFYVNGSFGRSVAGIGDINGDGYDDVIIGAPLASTNGLNACGVSYVVLGKSSQASVLKTSALLNGDGFVLFSQQAGELSGSSVAGAGDINGDGYADFIVGASGYDVTPQGGASVLDAGAAYVVYGHNGPFTLTVPLSQLGQPFAENGFRLEGVSAGDNAGISVSAVGDFNGDGLSDILIGASGSDVQGKMNAGRAYLLFGKSGAFPSSMSLGAIGASKGAQIVGINAGDGLGFAVGSAGDVNGDGLADIIVGARFNDVNANDSGESYVIYGRTAQIVGSLSAANADIRIQGGGASNLSGASVSSAGDFNGDGYDDLLIGAPGVGNNAGAGYVVFGRTDGFAAPVNLANLSGTDGFKLTGFFLDDQAGTSVHRAGDVNGDGYDDLIIGAPNGGPIDTGRAYVLYGSNGGNAVNIDATGKIATYTDADGDLVTVKVSKGMIDANDFVLSGANYLGGATLHKVDFAKDADLAGADVTISAKPQMIGGMLRGDGLANVGYFNADQVNLGKVKIGGDVGRVQFSSAKSLAVNSLGMAGTSTQIGFNPSLNSVIGVLPSLSVKTNVEGINFLAAKIGKATIGGDMENSSLFLSGGPAPAKGPAVALKSLTIGGDMDHSNIYGGRSIFGGNADVAIGKVLVKGDWIASNLTVGLNAGNDGILGNADDALYTGGNAAIMSKIASVVIKGQAIGSVEKGGHFAITAEKVGSVTIGKTKVALAPLAKDKLVAIGGTGDFVINEIG